eukprot:2263242-Rhodomonas_salina.1
MSDAMHISSSTRSDEDLEKVAECCLDAGISPPDSPDPMDSDKAPATAPDSNAFAAPDPATGGACAS